EEHGGKLLRPMNGVEWREEGRHREIRYFRGVAVFTDRGSTLHTHSPEPMQRMLLDVRPDLVFADHGFAGASLAAGIETLRTGAGEGHPARPESNRSHSGTFERGRRRRLAR